LKKHKTVIEFDIGHKGETNIFCGKLVTKIGNVV